MCYIREGSILISIEKENENVSHEIDHRILFL